MKTSNKGIELIMRFEGLKLNAYKCPAGVWTIGYGHTKNVKEGQTITAEQAKALLQNDVEKFEKELNRMNLPLSQSQFDALISFNYNLGTTAFSLSALLKRIKANPNDPAIRGEFMKWDSREFLF